MSAFNSSKQKLSLNTFSDTNELENFAQLCSKRKQVAARQEMTLISFCLPDICCAKLWSNPNVWFVECWILNNLPPSSSFERKTLINTDIFFPQKAEFTVYWKAFVTAAHEQWDHSKQFFCLLSRDVPALGGGKKPAPQTIRRIVNFEKLSCLSLGIQSSELGHKTRAVLMFCQSSDYYYFYWVEYPVKIIIIALVVVNC